MNNPVLPNSSVAPPALAHNEGSGRFWRVLQDWYSVAHDSRNKPHHPSSRPPDRAMKGMSLYLLPIVPRTSVSNCPDWTCVETSRIHAPRSPLYPRECVELQFPRPAMATEHVSRQEPSMSIAASLHPTYESNARRTNERAGSIRLLQNRTGTVSSSTSNYFRYLIRRQVVSGPHEGSRGDSCRKGHYVHHHSTNDLIEYFHNSFRFRSVLSKPFPSIAPT